MFFFFLLFVLYPAFSVDNFWIEEQNVWKKEKIIKNTTGVLKLLIFLSDTAKKN